MVNHDGKQEAIDLKLIDTVSKFLTSGKELEVRYSVVFFMFCSIHLEGKKQCTFFEEDSIIVVCYSHKAINL